MLVLKNIFGLVRDLHYFILGSWQLDEDNRSSTIRSYSDITFNILDTKTNKVKVYTLEEILSVEKPVFGVLKDSINTYGNNRDDRIIFMEISNELWKLLDLIDKPIYLSDTPLSTITKLCGNIERDESLSTIFEDVYITSDNCKICVINMLQVSNYLDDNCVFWKSSSGKYMTILNCYEYIFRRNIIDKDTIVYIVNENSDMFKFDINEGVIRFMTKLRTLKG